ncbi:MAG: ABC transporter substrate-binding protein [Chromatiales bacterium]|nr:ABC transporter substrate-binding protein [Chromatiales bacterium]
MSGLRSAWRQAILGLLTFCVVTGAHAAPPQRVASANLCTDQLLLMLAAPEQIASISHLALDREGSYMAEQAKGYPINYGTTEELIALEPDLILVSQFNRQKNTEILRHLGYRVEAFATTESIAGIRSNIRQMAKLLEREPEGEALIADMDRRIAEITNDIQGEPLPALFYQPRGYTSGLKTLHDEALKLTGWRNISAEYGVIGYGAIDLETVLQAKPVQLFTSAYAPGTTSLAQQQINHPALKKVTKGKTLINIEYRYWICGGPMIVEAIEKLAKVRRQ